MGLSVSSTSPALAAVDCAGGTEIYPGICEVTYSTPGTFTFTAPSGVTKVSAVIVGAGGGSNYAADAGGGYAGGGGDVIYIDAVDTSSPVAVTVGAGGLAAENSDATDGQASSIGTVSAAGGHGGNSASGGASGNGNEGSNYSTVSGAGGGVAGAAADCQGGPGTTFAEVSTNATLYPVLFGETVLGSGGNCYYPSYGHGNPPIGHGGDIQSETEGDPGSDGLVDIRWSISDVAPVIPLPDTGMTLRVGTVGLAVSALFAGLAWFAFSGRRRLRILSFDVQIRDGLAGLRRRLDKLESRDSSG